MSNEIINLEFIEVDSQSGKKLNDDESLLFAYDVGAVPRKGDRLYLARTEKVLGVDPEKEHRHFRVVEVEWWYEEETDASRRFGNTRNVGVFVERIYTSMFRW